MPVAESVRIASRRDRVLVIDEVPDAAALQAEVIAGLSQQQKTLPCKLFYDRTGSALFERICDLPEYYPTRTELALMRAHAPEMAALLGPRCLLVEYGSGSSTKTRLLLDHLVEPVCYAPVDVSREHLREASAALAAAYPRVPVCPVAADFTRLTALPTALWARGGPEPRRRVVYFPGSTIGNFPAPQDEHLLGRIAAICGPGGAALIGIDLQKPVAILEAAYNDTQGVTAAFNRNILTRINRELGGTFTVEAFAHRAFYNRERSRIEMHLVSGTAQEARVGDHHFRFRPGETIHTESSCKYTPAGFTALAARAGLQVEAVWTAPDAAFAVAYLTG